MQLSVKYETVLNMTTAKALGLDVPTSILLSADKLIDRNTATQEDWIADGGNGSLGDIPPCRGHVRFTPKSGHRAAGLQCPLSAHSRRGSLFDCPLGQIGVLQEQRG